MFDYIWVFLARAIARGGAFLTILVLAYSLNPEEIGEYGIVATTIFFAVYFGSLGIRHAAAYYIGKNKKEAGYVTSAVFYYSVLVGGGLTAIFWVIYSLFFSDFLNSNNAYYSFLAILPAIALYTSQGILLGYGNLSIFNRSEILPRTLALFFVLFLMIFDALSITSAILALILSYWFGAVYIWLVLWRKYDFKFHFELPESGMFRYGLPFSFSLALAIAIPLVTMVLLKGKLSPELVGYYFMAYKIIDILSESASSVGMVVFSRGVNSRVPKKALIHSLRIAKNMMFLLFILGLGITLTGAFISGFIVDVEISNVLSILCILAFCLPFVGFNRVISPALAAQEFAYVSVVSQFLALLSNFIFIEMFISDLGVVVGGYSVIISRFVSYFIFIIFLWRLLDVSFLNVILYRKSDMRAVARSVKSFIYIISSRRL